MATKTIAWQTGSGSITLTYSGQGDGTIIVESDENNLVTARSQLVTVTTTKGNPIQEKTVTITQAAAPNFRLSNGYVFAPSDYDYMNVQTT